MPSVTSVGEDAARIAVAQKLLDALDRLPTGCPSSFDLEQDWQPQHFEMLAEIAGRRSGYVPSERTVAVLVDMVKGRELARLREMDADPFRGFPKGVG